MKPSLRAVLLLCVFSVRPNVAAQDVSMRTLSGTIVTAKNEAVAGAVITARTTTGDKTATSVEFLFLAACGKHSRVTTQANFPTQKLRRIGVLGDIHCEHRRLEAALQYFQTEPLDMICAVGDLVDGPGDPNRTVELLRKYGVVTVRGNHERWLMKNEMRGLPDAQTRFDFDALAWVFLNNLPLWLKFETVAGRMLLCHGLGDDDMGGVWPFDDSLSLHSNLPLWRLVNSREFAFIVNGHTHRRLVRTFGEMTIINAGTLYRQHAPCFCIADFEQSFVQYFNVEGDGSIEVAEQFPIPPKTQIE